MTRLWLACALLAACASRPALPEVRFANAPIALAVNDRLDVARTPEKRIALPDLYVFDGTFYRRAARALELPRHHRALGVNALDEVPDSTWFTNRIGVRALTPEDIRTGPVTDSPERHKPWTITSTKTGGTAVGFIIKDASGAKYMLKFEDASQAAELETGAHMVVNRLLWACGYNVAEDHVVHLRPDDLTAAPDAAVTDVTGEHVRRLDRAEIDRQLARVRHEPDGRIRALASRWLDGVTLGGHPAEGVRGDDRNDRIPHEERRDLRGQYAIYAWLDAVDVTEGQFVDTWVADPKDKNRHYVKHYAIDFGKSLGVMADVARDWWRSVHYRIDLAEMVRSFFTFGLSSRWWADRQGPQLRGVASMFEARTFDPGGWHPDSPGYVPFLAADRFDNFWAAKIIARFTRDQIRAAVEAGQYTDPRAVDYLTDTLVARQRTTVAYWFARVNPLDRFAVDSTPDGDELCFYDLAITSRLAPASGTRYAITRYDMRGQQIDAQTGVAGSAGRTCARLPLQGASGDGYTIVRVSTLRPSFAGETFVHLARDPQTGASRVIGIWRS